MSWYDLDLASLTPSLPSPVRKLYLFLNLPMSRRPSLLTVERERWGGGGAKSIQIHLMVKEMISTHKFSCWRSLHANANEIPWHRGRIGETWLYCRWYSNNKTVFNFSDAEQHKCREELNNHLPPPHRPSEALMSRLTSLFQLSFKEPVFWTFGPTVDERKTVKMVAFKTVCIFPLFRWIQKEKDTITISVADPGWLFRILIFFYSGSQMRTKYVEEEVNIFLSFQP